MIRHTKRITMTHKEVITYTTTSESRLSLIYTVKNDTSPQNYPTADLQPSAVSVLESISHYYHILSGAGKDETDPSLSECFALRLAQMLISIISSERFKTAADGTFSDLFYRRCLNRADESGFADEIDDPDILLINIKQCLHIMRAAGILHRDVDHAKINFSGLTDTAMHQRLFNAFWNLTPWEDIFPSDPEAARELQIDRNILKDLLARHHGSVNLEVVANDYFELTGFSFPHDMEMISFLDFYFFAWMRHFGVIRYFEGQVYAPVRIAVTDIGRNILYSYS